MKKRLIGLFTLLICLSSNAFATQADFSKSTTFIINQFIKENNIPGIVVSIKLANQPIKTFVAGYANYASKQPMEADTLFPIGSITKSFTSAAILKLEEQGKLKISDDLSQVATPNSSLEILLEQYPHLKKIKIQQLLNHTSGLPEVLTSEAYERKFQENPELHWRDMQLMELAMKQNSYFSSDGLNKFRYTNTDYILAGLVVEAVTKKPLYIALQTLFNQANIHDVYFPKSASSEMSMTISQNLAHGYMPENPYWPKLMMQVFRNYPEVYINNKPDQKAYDVTRVDVAQLSVAPAAGGIVMTVPEMVQWYDCLFLYKNILNSQSLQEMLTTVHTDQDYNYGLGITTHNIQPYNLTTYSHTGSNFGYNTNLIYIVNNQIIIAVAINMQRDTLRINDGLILSLLNNLIKK